MRRVVMIVTLALIAGTGTLTAGEPTLAPPVTPLRKVMQRPQRVAQAEPTPTPVTNTQAVPPAPNVQQTQPVQQTRTTRPMATQPRYNNNVRRTYPTRSRGGFLSRMMDLERRKNAWLRRTFIE